MNFFNKGMSINVTLSDEQMEQIASLSADKVNMTRTHYMNETETLQKEVIELRRQLKRREDIVIEELLQDNNHKILCERLSKRIKKLTEENILLKQENETLKKDMEKIEIEI